ncbi:MAG: ATP-dependent RNA helicase HrpA [Burkholderiales bacterium]|nr:ATP-dependent RNA helicase HrpA [Burkholderiales bacterium]
MTKIIYPENLPVSQAIPEIKELVKSNQLVIVCGETGSGKTTQLPKMLYEMGYAEHARIGHTQPRRVAAKSIANRIAHEMDNQKLVGYKVRFQDKSSTDTKIKLMTDGILLQEIQTDKLLKQYSALIIDEAHERSLNIDFIIGYLKTILHNRPELKVIVTSATIENEKFSKFFNNAPIVNVEGKTYPVDIIYQPFEYDNDDINLNNAVYKAIESCLSIEAGNVLVFLPGEREIKDCIGFLKRTRLKQYQLLPLFSRQNERDQNLVFAIDNKLKIIITTNVAETSVTIPGIKYVIDSGLARIKRYNSRTKVEQLLVENISKASCKQRAGRAGRLSHGMCVRLFSEINFNTRMEFTTPEILRSNLSNVILRLIGYSLGNPLTFRFLDRPEDKAYNDGFKTLYQLSAIREDNYITTIGKTLSLIPIDVNLARMLYSSAFEFNVFIDVLIIISFLAIIDPREFSLELQNKAREVQLIWEDKDSDFITILNLWAWYKAQLQHKKTKRELHEYLQNHFLNPNRMREWLELHGQLNELMQNLITNNPISSNPRQIEMQRTFTQESQRQSNYQYIHQALLTGLLHNIGQKDLVENHYIGTLGKKFLIHPSSNISKPKWIVSANLVQTSRLYARINASIQSEWLVPLSVHLVKYTYSDARYEKKRGEVVSSEATLLYGLIISRKNVPFARINPIIANEIFIKDGVIPNELGKSYKFITHNQRVIQELDKLESKHRTALVIIEDELYKFYSNLIPKDISDVRTFDQWCKFNEEKLKINLEVFLEQFNKDDPSIELYPDFILSGTQKIKLKYVFDPTRDDDGINAYINLEELSLVDGDPFLWLVAGFIRDKITFMVKSLPKQIRVGLNPLNSFITNFLDNANFNNSLNQELCGFINGILKTTLSVQELEKISLPYYLNVHFNILDNNKTIYKTDSLLQAKNELADKLHHVVSKISSNYEIANITHWIDELNWLLTPTRLLINRREIIGYTALCVKAGNISYIVMDSLDKATVNTKKGVFALVKLNLSIQLKYFRQKPFTHFKATFLYLSDFYKNKDLFLEDVIDFVLRMSIDLKTIPKSDIEFKHLINKTKDHLGDSFNLFATTIYALALSYVKVKQQIKNHALQEIIALQLDDLIFPDFLRFVNYDILKHYPRYLDAIIFRLNKYKDNSNRDRIHEKDITKIYNSWYDGVDQLEANHKPVTRELYDFKYKVEELRVSLFAQELKTPYPVSAKRLFSELDELLNTRY